MAAGAGGRPGRTTRADRADRRAIPVANKRALGAGSRDLLIQMTPARSRLLFSEPGVFLAQLGQVIVSYSDPSRSPSGCFGRYANELDRFLRTSRDESLVWVNQFTHANEMSSADRRLIEAVRRKHQEAIDQSTLLMWMISDSTIFRALLRAGFVLMRAPYQCRVTDSLELAWRESAKLLRNVDPDEGIALHRQWIAEASSAGREAAPSGRSA